jgi:hypothetical protein
MRCLVAQSIETFILHKCSHSLFDPICSHEKVKKIICHVPLATSLSSISLTFNTYLPAQAATSGTLFLCYLLPALPLSHGGWHSSTSSRSRRRVRCLLLRHRAIARRSLLTCPTSARAVLAAPTDHSCADLSSPHDGIYQMRLLSPRLYRY